MSLAIQSQEHSRKNIIKPLNNGIKRSHIRYAENAEKRKTCYDFPLDKERRNPNMGKLYFVEIRFLQRHKAHEAFALKSNQTSA